MPIFVILKMKIFPSIKLETNLQTNARWNSCLNRLTHTMTLAGAWTFICFLLLTMASSSFGQSESQTQFGTLPKVFVIGDFQEQYESLFGQYPDILITACDNNIDTAQAAWFDYLNQMEAYSKKIAFDLEGIAFWIHFFWKPNGEAVHIAYHLQPHSRFIKDDAMLAFLRSFARTQKIKVTAARSYNHYGSASFPLYFQRPTTRTKASQEDK